MSDSKRLRKFVSGLENHSFKKLKRVLRQKKTGVITGLLIYIHLHKYFEIDSKYLVFIENIELFEAIALYRKVMNVSAKNCGKKFDDYKLLNCNVFDKFGLQRFLKFCLFLISTGEMNMGNIGDSLITPVLFSVEIDSSYITKQVLRMNRRYKWSLIPFLFVTGNFNMNYAEKILDHLLSVDSMKTQDRSCFYVALFLLATKGSADACKSVLNFMHSHTDITDNIIFYTFLHFNYGYDLKLPYGIIKNILLRKLVE